MKGQYGKITLKTPNTLRIWKIKWHYVFLNPKDNLCVPKKAWRIWIRIKNYHPFLNMPRQICFLQAAKINANQKFFFFLISHYAFLCVPKFKKQTGCPWKQECIRFLQWSGMETTECKDLCSEVSSAQNWLCDSAQDT